MSQIPEIEKADERLEPLAHDLRRDGKPCPFVVNDEAAKFVALAHYSAGPDATYVVVSRKLEVNDFPPQVAVTIGYAPFVEGTMIIYDVTAETMQGKARPFVCNLERGQARVYAILPFQIEDIEFRLERSAGIQRLHVAFLDARGQIMRAALPFELRLLGGHAKELGSKYLATDRQGRCCAALGEFRENPPAQAFVRSLLTGRELIIAIR